MIKKILLMENNFNIFKSDVSDFIGVFDTDFKGKEFIDYFKFLKQTNNTFRRDYCSRKNSVLDEVLFVGIESYRINADVLILEKYNDLMNFCLREYAKQYQVLHDINCVQYTVNIQKTEKSEGFHNFHFEKSNNFLTYTRHLTTMVYLNDVLDGGETEFLYQSRRVKPREGRVVIFPVQWTHTHRGNPPLSGEKYIATSWIHLNDSNLPE
jgi:hypothetical protein